MGVVPVLAADVGAVAAPRVANPVVNAAASSAADIGGGNAAVTAAAISVGDGGPGGAGGGGKAVVEILDQSKYVNGPSTLLN